MGKNTCTEEEYDMNFFGGLIFGVFITMVLGGMFLSLGGAFDSPMTELELDKDVIAETHVLKYYPEYDNCSFQYKESNEIECELYIPGVEVFCKDVDDRDGMNVLGTDPTLTLCFDDITIEEIFKNIVSDYK